MLIDIYRFLTTVGAPLIRVYMRRRLAMGKEDGTRFSERFGQASVIRQAGRLLWCHAASVGEVVSLLLLVEKLQDRYKDATLLITTGTVTAANLVASRRLQGVIHQYYPIDCAKSVEDFLDHWRPDFVFWTESELWPNMLISLRKRNTPVVLLNARMSERSFRNWNIAKRFAREVMSSFRLCLAQTEQDMKRFSALGAENVKLVGNLKYASSPLPFNEDELQKLRNEIGGRDTWLMASTHRGEEEFAAAAHSVIASNRPDLLTIVVPRHAVRGDEIAKMFVDLGFTVSRKSKGEKITASTQIYLADTMGELGLFYSLCKISVLGGSFVKVGGHNPIEPAQLGSAIVFGSHMYNFAEIAKDFLKADAAIQIGGASDISFAVERLMADNDARLRLSASAKDLTDSKAHVIDNIMSETGKLIGLRL